MKSITNQSLMNVAILFAILISVGFLYKRFEDKRIREQALDTHTAIQKYLLDGETLGDSKKPILWVHVPYEYNARKWDNFASRGSFDLNQPYLYLTIKSIIKYCDNSFTICIIDDAAFKKLLPEWKINMSKISDPILYKMRALGIAQLIHMYGGLVCPVSFLCLKDLITMYNKGTQNNQMFSCETIDRNITSTDMDFFPSLRFYGAPKESPVVGQLIQYIQQIVSKDYTAETKFLGAFDKWIMKEMKNGKIKLIDGMEIGTKNMEEKQILVDDLMSNNFLDLYEGCYGILIPSDELLKRRKYEWFTRLSQKQVMESDTIIGNYLLLSASSESAILKPAEPLINKAIQKEFIGFWKLPSDAPNYGLKPNFLGDNVNKIYNTSQ